MLGRIRSKVNKLRDDKIKNECARLIVKLAAYIDDEMRDGIANVAQGEHQINCLKKLLQCSPNSDLDELISKEIARVYHFLICMTDKEDINQRYLYAKSLIKYINDGTNFNNDTEYYQKIMNSAGIAISKQFDELQKRRVFDPDLLEPLLWLYRMSIKFDLAVVPYIICNKISSWYLQDEENYLQAHQKAIEWAKLAINFKYHWTTVKWLCSVYISIVKFYIARNDKQMISKYLEMGLSYLIAHKEIFDEAEDDKIYANLNDWFYIAKRKYALDEVMSLAENKTSKLVGLKSVLNLAIERYNSTNKNDKTKFFQIVKDVILARYAYLANRITSPLEDVDEIRKCLKDQDAIIEELPDDDVERIKAVIFNACHKVSFEFAQWQVTRINRKCNFKMDEIIKMEQTIKAFLQRLTQSLNNDSNDASFLGLKEIVKNSFHNIGTIYAVLAEDREPQQVHQEAVLEEIRITVGQVLAETEARYALAKNDRKIYQTRMKMAFVNNDSVQAAINARIWMTHLHSADPKHNAALETAKEKLTKKIAMVLNLFQLEATQRSSSADTCKEYYLKFTARNKAKEELVSAVAELSRIKVKTGNHSQNGHSLSVSANVLGKKRQHEDSEEFREKITSDCNEISRSLEEGNSRLNEIRAVEQRLAKRVKIYEASAKHTSADNEVYSDDIIEKAAQVFNDIGKIYAEQARSFEADLFEREEELEETRRKIAFALIEAEDKYEQSENSMRKFYQMRMKMALAYDDPMQAAVNAAEWMKFLDLTADIGDKVRYKQVMEKLAEKIQEVQEKFQVDPTKASSQSVEETQTKFLSKVHAKLQLVRAIGYAEIEGRKAKNKRTENGQSSTSRSSPSDEMEDRNDENFRFFKPKNQEGAVSSATATNSRYNQQSQ